MSPGTTAVTDNYEVTPPGGGGPSLHQPMNTVYQLQGKPPEVVRHVHPAAAVCHSIPMAVGQESQIAPLTASIDDVLERIETVANIIKESLKCDISEGVRDEIRVWSNHRGSDHPFLLASRFATLNLLLKATLYETHSQRGELPILSGRLDQAFEAATDRTGNNTFEDGLLDEIAWRIHSDVVAAVSWWRHGLMTADNPADDIGYLFEELIPAEERRKHGQVRTPRRISTLIRELAIRDGDRVLDPGIGAGALSVPRNQSKSVRICGVERSRIGFLMAVTALALTEQPCAVHEDDFFAVRPESLGVDADTVIGERNSSRHSDAVPARQVDAVVGNPPYVANRI